LLEKRPSLGGAVKIELMDYQTSTLSDTEIESLAQETHAPHELVRELYAAERAKLEKTAKIKTYVPVLIRRRVKAMLQASG
jgi:hypothetical protein